MPPQQGETTLLTLYADCHYYLGPPTEKPPHDRFDKGSYVYVHQRAPQGTGRIEVANNPGQADQDAFSGGLENAYFTYSYKRPAQFTVTVLQGQVKSPQEWALPAFDQRKERKYMYPLNSIDFYFWEAADGQDFLGALQKMQHIGGLRIDDAPHNVAQESRMGDQVSPVVQQLEHVAITNPYQPEHGGAGSSHSVPPPPPAQQPYSPSPQHSGAVPQSSYSQYNNNSSGSPAPTSTPLAYNPAAPAAPEPRHHREKTPPPPDAATGTGLGQAAVSDHGAVAGPGYHPQQQQHYGYQPSSSYGGQQYGSPHATGPGHNQGFGPQATGPTSYGQSPPPPQQQQSFPGPPQQQQSFSGPPSQTQHQQSFAGPPAPGIHRTNTAGSQTSQSFPPPPPPPAGQPGSPPQQQTTQSFAPPPQNNSSTQYAQASPGSQAGSHFSPPPQHQVHSPPPGGYSQYSYSQQQQGQGQEGQSVHQQAYRPTEAEATGKLQAGQAAAAGPGTNPGKLEARAEKLEKGMNRFLKKLDKGW